MRKNFTGKTAIKRKRRKGTKKKKGDGAKKKKGDGTKKKKGSVKRIKRIKKIKRKSASRRKTNVSRKTNFNTDSCTPTKGKEDLMKFTCYTKDALKKIKNLWNARHPDTKIKTNNPKQIWDQLRNNMSSSCNRESCWLKQKWFDQGMVGKLEENFAPEQPETWKKNKNEWLNSLDINKVMKQYENNFENFEFIGPSPIDFDDHEMYGECVWDELCKFQLEEKIKNNKQKIGIIFNLDTHDKPGSHWVAMFINIDKGEICYFDSYGDKTPNRIKKFANRIQDQSAKIGNRFHFHENEVRHQYSNSECGMYCLYFIIKLVENKLYKSLIKKKIPDKEMMELRNIYFNKV